MYVHTHTEIESEFHALLVRSRYNEWLHRATQTKGKVLAHDSYANCSTVCLWVSYAMSSHQNDEYSAFYVGEHIAEFCKKNCFRSHALKNMPLERITVNDDWQYNRTDLNFRWEKRDALRRQCCWVFKAMKRCFAFISMD